MLRPASMATPTPARARPTTGVIHGVICSTWADAALASRPRAPNTTRKPAATHRATPTARATAAPVGRSPSSPEMNHPR